MKRSRLRVVDFSLQTGSYDFAVAIRNTSGIQRVYGREEICTPLQIPLL
ncbi:MAG TPA: hypothetical protein VMH89_06560 [Candidatus Acidoferrum sp.]|nr:hypothetical protein [Candidatus Acidoferrum sp.]